MAQISNSLAAAAALALLAGAAAAQTPPLPIADEPPARLFVDAPLTEPLAARGVAVIPYRTENFRILPLFGAAAADVSPRAGHLHVTVDDLPWHWADAGGVPVVIVGGLAAGRHEVRLELATPEHRILTAQTVTFVVPAGDHHHTPTRSR